MKNLYLLFSASFFFLYSHAQYSSDTLNPLAVCNAKNVQSAVAALNDGKGGSFVFWLDDRDTTISNQIFGQHLNSNGDAIWTANGKLIASTTTSIIGFQIAKWQSGMLLAWVQRDVSGYGDSLFCKYIDTSGNDNWVHPTLIAQKGNGYISIDQDGFNIIPNDSGATITHSYTYTGGNSGFTFNRIDFNGNLYWPVLSKTFVLQDYDYRSSSDGGNGFYALSKGNGEGSSMYIQRFSLQGNPLWVTGLDITGGVDGFYGNISMLADSQSNLYVAWDANNGNVDVARVTPSGEFGWAANRIRLSDTSAYSPGRSYARLIDNNLYVTWLESRMPYVGSSLMQKLDTSGAILWGTGGLVVATVNVYDTYPKLAAADSNAVVNTFIGPNNSDMNIERVRSDGSLTWGGNGKVLGSGNPQALTGTDYALLDNANGCNPIFWTSQSSNIFGSDACISYGVATGVEQDEENGAGSLIVFPNPARSSVTLKNSSGQSLNQVSVYDVTGRTVTTILPGANSFSLKLDVSKWEPGIYFIQSLTEGTSARNTFVVQ